MSVENKTKTNLQQSTCFGNSKHHFNDLLTVWCHLLKFDRLDFKACRAASGPRALVCPHLLFRIYFQMFFTFSFSGLVLWGLDLNNESQ